MEKKKSNSLVGVIVVAVLAVVMIALAVLVNNFTADTIATAEINARAESYRVAYESAKEFAEIDELDKLLEEAPAMLSENGFDGCEINDALAVLNTAGAVKGYVVSATSPNGYGGNVQVVVGIENGKLMGFGVISHNETPGFGAKCTDDAFTSQFAGKKATILEVNKSGGSGENQIDAISGATITSKAVAEATNAAIAFYQMNFGDGTLAPVMPYTIESDEATDNGHKIVVSTDKGFAGTIKLAVEIDNDGVFTSFEVLESKETQGYGAACTNEEYAQMFVGLKADTAITYVSGGASKDNNEVDAIAGATFTTKAIDVAVNGVVEYYNTELKGA